MAAPDQDLDDPSQILMEGNYEEHPDAYIIFRIFVDLLAEE